MCGVERSQLVTLFEKFGNIQRILMFPGQSFSFISFKAVSESVKAMDTIHGRLLDCPSEFPRPETRFYLSFLVGVPDDVTVEKPVKPDGLILVEDFLNHAEEEELIQALGWVNDGSENGIEGTGLKVWDIPFGIYPHPLLPGRTGLKYTSLFITKVLLMLNIGFIEL